MGGTRDLAPWGKAGDEGLVPREKNSIDAGATDSVKGCFWVLRLQGRDFVQKNCICF